MKTSYTSGSVPYRIPAKRRLAVPADWSRIPSFSVIPRARGLDALVARQGLALRLHNGPLNGKTAPDGYVSMAGSRIRSVTGPWVDVPRTEKLFDHVLVHHTGIPEAWGHWPDHSTIGIPNYYAWGYYALAQAAMSEGQTARVRQFQERGAAWLRLGTAE